MVKIIPLGGLGEIGLNMMVIEHDHYILVVDAGLMFPEDYMPGVDMVIPDFQYLRDNRNAVQSILLTHGHEDHIGAMPFLLKEFNIPVFGSNFTIELLGEKLREHNLLEEAVLNKVQVGESRQFGPFRVEFIRVDHSIIDGMGLAIETPEGIIVHSGDFKIDQTPVGKQSTDLSRFAHYGGQDVLLFMSDSTNAEKEGFTLSERKVGKTLEELFASCRGRIILAVFASNINRIQQVVNLALTFGRKIHFSGKSMRNNVRISKSQGLIEIPDKTEIEEHELSLLPDHQITMITTGSQGEPMSALTRMAQNRHKHIRIHQGDTVILSSRFIPGNEKAITAMINNLYRMGAEVVYEKVSHIHSSGHAYREELKLIMNLVKPKYFLPIHGEYRHLVKHVQLAVETGIPVENALLVENGNPVAMKNGQITIENPVQTGRVLVDGKGLGGVGELVLRDRRKLAGDGIVIAFLAVNEQTGEVVYGPEMISKGFVFEDQEGFLLEDAKCIILEILDEIERPSRIDWADIAPDIKRRLKRFFYKVIERSPLILPIIIPV